VPLLQKKELDPRFREGERSLCGRRVRHQVSSHAPRHKKIESYNSSDRDLR